jgi:hypothetical protein
MFEVRIQPMGANGSELTGALHNASLSRGQKPETFTLTLPLM